jgi:hypothetical protein
MILTSTIPREIAMEKVQLSTDVLAKIGGVTFPTELCDEAGATRAVVMPVEMYREMFSAWAGTAFREEDLARARTETGGYTTAEVLAKIGKLVAERGGK